MRVSPGDKVIIGPNYVESIKAHEKEIELRDIEKE